MSRFLWQSFLEDDVVRFRQLLEGGGLGPHSHTQRNISLSTPKGHDISDDFADSISPTSPLLRARNSVQRDERQPASLTRTDINSRDGRGLTILHHAASSTADNAKDFAFALLAHPHIDLYLQDHENGWTALHRAFYFGNVTIARAILERDAPHPGRLMSAPGQIASLAKVKDKEGYGPYDLLSMTIADRSLRSGNDAQRSDDANSSDGEQEIGSRAMDQEDEHGALARSKVPPGVNVRADELFTFGSNKNLTLGLGDQDDRQYPERIYLKRPARLYERFHRQHAAARVGQYQSANLVYAERVKDRARTRAAVSDLPDIIRNKPIVIQDVQMAKFHTAVLTTDPIANLYLCGHGLGGRLGTGHEKTLFNFNCLDEFGSARISAVALGQDHTLAVTDAGELYSWGLNIHGQLGCGMPKENPKPEEAMQLSPKQIFGPIKNQIIIGAAASRIHSVAFTSSALFTFGKNEGQLGLVDSQAGTLKVQSTPRQVYASRLSSTIHSVAATDRATVTLLDNREAHVFANYGAVKLQFPLDGFSNYFLRESFLTTKYDKTPNRICKITCGGDTICALSTSGEIFTVTVNQRLDPSASGTTSTTNPNKIRAALSAPHRAWTLKSDRMAARDIGVDTDGSIVLSTESGGVFRRIRRPKAAGSQSLASRDQKSKEFKFMRVPNLTRAVGVRASSSGAYCAFRYDCNVTQKEMLPGSNTLGKDVFGMLAIKSLAQESPAPSFWQRPDAVKRLVERISHAVDVESEVASALRQDQSYLPSADVLIRSTSSDYAIPAHRVILAGRSPVLRNALASAHRQDIFEHDMFSIQGNSNGKLTLTFAGLDFLTLLEIVLYLYADALVGFWRLRHESPSMAFRYKQVRAELMKVGTKLELRNLEAAARKVITRPEPSMAADFELALTDPAFFAYCDARVQLADGEALVHIELVARRCPFFEGLFQGHAGGQWLTSRRNDPEDLVEVDLSHVELKVFNMVLRYIYADTGEEMFDDINTGDLDEFLDLVLDVLSVANELMLDNLSQTCQFVLGKHVTTRNACQLLNAVAPSSVEDFKDVTLEYLCLSLEPLLANHWLDELDEDLLSELDSVVRENQQAAAPFVRSGRMEERLHEKHPELAELILRARQAKIDALDIKARYPDAGSPVSQSFGKSRPSPSLHPKSPTIQTSPKPLIQTPLRRPASPKALEPLPSPAQTGSSFQADSDIMLSSSPGSPQGRPWGPSPLPGAKLGIKEIMAQASTPRTSNLSLGLQSESPAEGRSSCTTVSKMSQKERKRQQQQQQRASSDQVLPASSERVASSPATSSPWKTVSSSSKAATNAFSERTSSSEVRRGSSPATGNRTPSTPQLTMRQTVANAPATSAKQAPSTPASASKPPMRSVSTPASAPSPGSSKTTPSASDFPALSIQSIRHQPRPDLSPDSSASKSLADIMSREQAQKTTLQDAIAKRSLQEIQEEQAFQEWWDKESAAVQEAQKLSESPSNRRSRGGTSRGRGRARQRRGGKQRGETPAAEGSSQS